MFTPDDIRRYYDRNTESFIRRSQAGADGAIHRAVWGPGVTDRAGAFRYVDDMVAAQIRTLDGRERPAHVLDLGCGVGASLIYLAQQLPIRGTGVTISAVQAALARERVAAAGLVDRVRCLEGDYTSLPPDITDVDLAYALESFVHGPSAERFFAEAARVIRPGGLLVVCDDIRRPTSDPKAAATLEQFVSGWHVNTLVTREELRRTATSAGLQYELTTELTPYLELERARDRAVALLSKLVGWAPRKSPHLAPLVGGHALQQALKRGWLAFEFSVFRKLPTPNV